MHTPQESYLDRNSKEESVWSLHNLGQYNVASFYKKISSDSTRFLRVPIIWEIKEPARVCSSLWLFFCIAILIWDTL